MARGGIALARPFLKNFVHFLPAKALSLSTAHSDFLNPGATLFLHQKTDHNRHSFHDIYS